ncbi:MAG: prepilin-type N-terminal cleavage/methylation domain-containing protein [Enterocloster asparagiformis]|nr:prepilin-type N-terminal cleavage/methylation domain-containing protein [Enterocloster asparagiformis]
MNRMSKKLNKKGFTLAELLIVVAIIAVLVAVSVPIFSSKLEKAREATDVANMRAAKAAAAAMYLGDDKGEIKATDKYFYDAEKGILSKVQPSKGYGQGTETNGGVTYEGYDNKDCAGKVIQVVITPPTEIDKDVEITMEWVK